MFPPVEVAFIQPDPTPVMKKIFNGENAEVQHHAGGVEQVLTALASMSLAGLALARQAIAKAGRNFFRSILKS